MKISLNLPAKRYFKVRFPLYLPTIQVLYNVSSGYKRSLRLVKYSSLKKNQKIILILIVTGCDTLKIKSFIRASSIKYAITARVESANASGGVGNYWPSNR